jgi:hypothetical protein
VVYLIVVCIACNFTIACLKFDAYVRMSGVYRGVTYPICELVKLLGNDESKCISTQQLIFLTGNKTGNVAI